MKILRLAIYLVAISAVAVAPPSLARQNPNQQDEGFGPVVSAYLGYLRNEQEVVDDRVSRREISRAYYRRNSNRIRALRETAIRIARESGNDYLPELEAVAADEMGTLFQHPPNPSSLYPGEILSNTFRYLGSVRSVDIFYVFARLDVYEQAERRAKGLATTDAGPAESPNTKQRAVTSRPRRVANP